MAEQPAVLQIDPENMPLLSDPDNRRSQQDKYKKLKDCGIALVMWVILLFLPVVLMGAILIYVILFR